MTVGNVPVPVTTNTNFSKLTIISFLLVLKLQTTTYNLNDATFKNLILELVLELQTN